jgi:hypothetical protein
MGAAMTRITDFMMQNKTGQIMCYKTGQFYLLTTALLLFQIHTGWLHSYQHPSPVKINQCPQCLKMIALINCWHYHAFSRSIETLNVGFWSKQVNTSIHPAICFEALKYLLTVVKHRGGRGKRLLLFRKVLISFPHEQVGG